MRPLRARRNIIGSTIRSPRARAQAPLAAGRRSQGQVVHDVGLPEESLDRLVERALAAERDADEALFSNLRVRFLAIAKRRVREDDWEDVVQEALRIVKTRYGEKHPRVGILPWSLTVLRNVIGNYYQSRSRNAAREELSEDALASAARDADESEIDAGRLANRIGEAVGELLERNKRCGMIFKRILESLQEGAGAREIPGLALERVREDHPQMSSATFYVTLHRCRARLRKILDEIEARGKR